MVTLKHSAASRRMLRASRLLLLAAAFLFASVTADAQGQRAHLSNDLQQHLDAGDATATTVIVTGTPDQIAAIAARHGLGVRRLLTSGAVFEVPAGRLDELAAGAHLVSVKVLGSDGSGHISDLIEGIDWVIANHQRYQIDVINLSLGAPVQQSWRHDPVCQAIERAWHVNIVTVVAAGNYGKTADGTEVLGGVTSPGNCPYAITAGTVNTKGTTYRSDDVIATYSSRGPTAIDHLLKPDLLAPGNKVRSLLSPGAVIAQQYPEKVVGDRLELAGT